MKPQTKLLGGILILAAAALGWISLGRPYPPTPEFQQANQAYSRGEYAQAATTYQSLLARDGYSVPVLYNLGNAWLQLHEPGRAILSYERALTLAPLNPAITANLHIAQQQSGHSPVGQTPFDRIRKRLSLNILAGIATLAAVIFATAILTARIRRSEPSPLLWGLAASGALLLLVSGGLLIARAPELDQAVILLRASPARVAPADAAETTFVLHAGDIVQAGKSYQSYIQVQTEDGRTGWVRAGQLERVLRPVDAAGRIA